MRFGFANDGSVNRLLPRQNNIAGNRQTVNATDMRLSLESQPGFLLKRLEMWSAAARQTAQSFPEVSASFW